MNNLTAYLAHLLQRQHYFATPWRVTQPDWLKRRRLRVLSTCDTTRPWRRRRCGGWRRGYIFIWRGRWRRFGFDFCGGGGGELLEPDALRAHGGAAALGDARSRPMPAHGGVRGDAPDGGGAELRRVDDGGGGYAVAGRVARASMQARSDSGVVRRRGSASGGAGVGEMGD